MFKWLKKLFTIEGMLPKSGVLGEIPNTKETYKNLMTIAIPSIAEMVLMSLIGSIDTMMVGTIGPEAIAAVGLVGQPRMLMICIFFALNTGVTAIVARRKGENRSEDANKTMRTALILILGISAVMMTLGLLFSKSLMLFAGAQPDTVDMAEDYFRILMYFLPANAISMCICAALRGIGNTKITMYVNITSNLVNVFFNWLLINGIGPFPKLGVSGAAIATVIGMTVGCILSLYAVFNKHTAGGFLHLSLKDKWTIDKESIQAITKVGGNAMIEQVCLRIGFFAYAKIVASLGTQAFASHQIAMQFLNISFTFGDGIGVAGTSLVGQNLGKKRPDISTIYGNAAQRVAFLAAVTIATFFVTFRYPLAALFTTEQYVLVLSAKVMIVVGIFQPFQTSGVVMAGVLRGAGDTKYVARVMMLCVTIIRPVCSFLAVWGITSFGPTLFGLTEAASIEYALIGAWCSSLLDMSLRAFLMFKRFLGGKWHSIKV